jgi:cellulose synthase operon protein C
MHVDFTSEPEVLIPSTSDSPIGAGVAFRRCTVKRVAVKPFLSISQLNVFMMFALGVFMGCTGTIRAEPTPANQPDANEASREEPPTLNDAREWYMRGDYDRALKAFEALAAEEKSAVEAELGIALCRMRVGQYQEAVDGLRGRPRETSADWHYILARGLNYLGHYDDVIRHTESTIELGKNHAGARLLRAQTLETTGKRDDALDVYRWFERVLVERRDLPRDAAWMTDAAVGFVRYSELTRNLTRDRLRHALHQMLQMAYERVDRTYWPARVAAGDLLRARYNNDEFDGSVGDYLAALQVNDQLPEAHVGLGLVALEHWGFEEIEKRVAAALDVNPNFVPALNLQARKLILERRYEDAIQATQEALAVNPNDVTALSLSAAAAACRYNQIHVEEMERRVAQINPQCALFYRTLGDALSGIRQFEASERAYLKAIEYEPTDANAHTELGMMYMQWGPEDKAREALEAAWALDQFNERTKFTLELLDMVSGFAAYETKNFVIRHDTREDPGLGEFMGNYLEQLHDEITADYDATLTHKTEIQVFPTSRQFAVRITGKPWIHTVGACTGRVIALASPRESPQTLGSYNLASVLRHEFTHTVTLAATENRIPHWFTEGLAVYQEESPRRYEWCMLLADAVRRNRLFTLESIDWGFIRPKRPSDRQMAYAQSEWMVEFIVKRYGYDAINDMIRLFREGRTQVQVFDEQFGISTATFDESFAAWAREYAKRWGFDLSPVEDVEALRDQVESLSAEDESSASLKGREAAELWARLARAELDSGELPEALQAAQQSLKLDQSIKSAMEVLVSVYSVFSQQEANAQARRDYDSRALPTLERLLETDPDGWIAPKYFADIMLRRKEWDRAAEALQRLQRVMPIDPASWRGLAAIYLERGDDEKALPQLIELARLIDDDADVRAKVGRIYRRQGRLRDAQYWLNQAVFIEPFNPSLHETLAETCVQLNDARCALRQYEMLTKLEPNRASYFEGAALAAKRLGDDALVEKYARRAVELDPKSGARLLIP